MELNKEWFRPAAYYLVKAMGQKQKDVAKLFGVSNQCVSGAIKRFQETGTHKDREGKGRKRTARSEQKIEEATRLLQQNNHTRARNGVSGNSSRKLGLKLEISAKSAHRILREDLKPWRMQERQKLNEVQKRKRLQLATELKRRFADGRHRQILFTDEK